MLTAVITVKRYFDKSFTKLLRSLGLAISMLLEPILKNIAEAFQKSGSNSVQGFNQIINNIIKSEENDA